jgi:sugar/nucleoside kinase (ribokinase family)
MIDLCTVGDLNWLIVLPVSHIPRQGEILMVKRGEHLLGNDAAIVSLMAARLGMQCRLLATNAIAQHDGQPLIDMLQQEGVDTSLVDTDGAFTPATFFFSCIASDERAAIVEEHAFHCSVAPDWHPNCTFAYIDLYEEHLDERLAFLHAWSQTNVRCLINLSASHLEEKVRCLAHISSIDTIQMRGSGSVDEAHAWGRRVFQLCDTKVVVITLGSVGAVLVDQHGSHLIPAEPVHPVRTVSAGATFIAGFISALAGGATYRDAVGFACKHAANFCTATMNPLEVIKR